MSRSIFGGGSNYPPGCSGPPDDEEGPCLTCGATDLHKCICPECPDCGTAGDPECYLKHSLKFTPAQMDGRAKLEEWMKKERERDQAEADYFASLCPQCDGAGVADYYADELISCTTCGGTGKKKPIAA
jgi:RecJ-like exonuclease